MMLYLMQVERNEASMNIEEDFKNLVFANNPTLYEALFYPKALPVDGELPGLDDLVIPETAGDIANLLSDLKDMGLDLGDTDID